MMTRQWRSRAVQWFLEKGLGAPPDVTMFLGDRLREWSPFVRIEARALWAAESRSRRILALLRGRWSPSTTLIQTEARQAYRRLYFGGDEDCGEDLGILNDWHLSRDWELGALTEADSTRASALVSFTVLTRLRYQDVQASNLNLSLALRAPYVADLIYPMTAKIPILSMRYFLELHVHYAFNAIRRANHRFGDDIVSFLYDLLLLQQKTAIALLEYTRVMIYAEQNKGQAQLINAEVSAIMIADGLFAYLKASVEKTIALAGVTHEVANLDAKKEHKKRVEALRSGLPVGVDKLPYANFLFEMVGTENLESLNNYRTGLLHKKGIADLQPHNYVGKSANAVPLRKILGVLHEQHSKNSALLLVTLALLTDKLVLLDPPSFSVRDLPTERKVAELPKRIEAEEASLTSVINEVRARSPDGVRGETLLARARRRLFLGRDSEALLDLQELLALKNEPSPELLHDAGLLAMDLVAGGKDRLAVEAFSRAIALRPDMENARVGRAFAYENLGDLALAVVDLNVAIPRVTMPAELLEKRGIWHVGLKNHIDALADFDTAIALGHTSLDLLTGRGVALRALGDQAGSLVAFNSAIDRFPSAAVARMHRATSFLESDSVSAARADLDWIISEKPDHQVAPNALILRAVLNIQASRREEAVADIEEAIARSKQPPPSDWSVLLADARAALAVDGT